MIYGLSVLGCEYQSGKEILAMLLKYFKIHLFSPQAKMHHVLSPMVQELCDAALCNVPV